MLLFFDDDFLVFLWVGIVNKLEFLVFDGLDVERFSDFGSRYLVEDKWDLLGIFIAFPWNLQ